MPDTENISWTASFVERFSLSKVCIFKAETLLGSMMGVNLPFEFCWPKHCSHPVNAGLCCQNHLGKHFGCWFHLQSIFITCKLLFWRNTVLGSPYWILITKNKLDSKCNIWLRLSLHREQSVDTTSFVEMFNLLWMSPFNSGTLSGNILGINLPVVDCWQNSVFTLQIIEGFTLSPLTKTPWVLIFTSLSSIFNACKLLCWRKNCACISLLCSAYRTLV